jgi:hypothetical protein
LWRHPILGEQAAGELKLPRHSQLLIRWHHEWWNGGGYPDGLAGKAIPLGARILRAVDSYFALISDRPHRGRFDRIEAEQIIADLAGIEFDPQVVKLLLLVLAEEAAVESAFLYPAAGGDEAVARIGEDQPQPLDETVYAPAYATRQVETPAEPSGGGQSAAPDSVSSQATDGVMDEDMIETRAEMTAVDFASSEAPGEVEGETRAEAPAADFASSNAIEAAGIEIQTKMAGVHFPASETHDEVMAGGRMEIATTDFTSSEGLDKAVVESHTEMAGAETKITQEKLES